MKYFIRRCKSWFSKTWPLCLTYVIAVMILVGTGLFLQGGNYVAAEQLGETERAYKSLRLAFFLFIIFSFLIFFMVFLSRRRAQMQGGIGSDKQIPTLKVINRIACFMAIVSFISIIYIFPAEYILNLAINLLGLSEDIRKEIGYGQFYRNRGFAFAAIIGLLFTIIGVTLTFWGRVQTKKQIKLKQDSNASERYENAARMLGDSVLTVRTAGCHALTSIGTENKKMAIQCANLLAAYIDSPYIQKNELEKIETLTDEEKEEQFIENGELRSDIKAAANSLFDIYQYYQTENVNFNDIIISNYFWKHSKNYIVRLRKATISDNLRKAYLPYARLEGAEFFLANLQGSHFHKAYLNNANFEQANLQEVDFTQANLTGTNLTGAILFGVNGLTKEQILSATWGYGWVDNKALEMRPKLPEEFLEDEDIKKWLKRPHHNEYK